MALNRSRRQEHSQPRRRLADVQRDATLPGWRLSPNNFPIFRSITRVVSWIACWTERLCGPSALGRARRLLSDLLMSVTVTAGRARVCYGLIQSSVAARQRTPMKD